MSNSGISKIKWGIVRIIKNIFFKDYIGCYIDSIRQLTGLISSMLTSLSVGQIQFSYFVQINAMTVSFCINLCYLLNFPYAGINGG